MNPYKQQGFTLIELLITLVIVGILSMVALPSYRSYVVKGSRAAAQTELLQMASLQEKIYLNSSKYAASVTKPYNGTHDDANGLGSAATSKDRQYAFSISTPGDGQSFTLTATPVSGGTQQGDGNLSINQSGQRLWGSAGW